MTIAEWLQTNDQMCIDIVKRKYLLDEDILGHKETIDELLDRVSGGNKKARNLMAKRKFIPGGRIIANRGVQKYGVRVTYSNCYVDAPPEDSIESIYNTCARLARTFSYGGGIGIDISKLAPNGAKVNNSAKFSTGAISFVNTFSEVSETIGQLNRRGALMISIDGHHPDLLEFITHKSDLEITQGANMSVRMTDDFFEAVKNDETWKMTFERPETGEVIERTESARNILNLIAKTNWDYAEPGLLYWDTISNYNLMSEDPNFEYAGTNPCAEEPLPAGGSCLLGAMNLSMYWRKNNRFAFADFTNDVKTAVRFLNEVLDEGEPLHPLKEQRETVTTLRQIGLGFMGLGDLFIQSQVRYGSKESVELCHKIGYRMIFAALQESAELAQEKGCFDKCDPKLIIKSKFFEENVTNNPYYSKEEKRDLKEKILTYGLRNSQLLTCAPTGTTSTIFNVSGGIEPIFALRFTRTTKSIYTEDKTYEVYPRGVQYFLDKKGYNTLDEVVDFPDYLVTSRDIDWKGRINVQAAWQKHIDASISATINLPESTTVEEVADLYMYAHDAGLKGTTVFRENCKRIAILNDSFKKKDDTSSDTELTDFEKDVIQCNKDICEKLLHNGPGLPVKADITAEDPVAAMASILNIAYHFSNKYENNVEIWKFEHNCHGDPKECTIKNKCPDCTTNIEDKKAIIGYDGSDEECDRELFDAALKGHLPNVGEIKTPWFVGAKGCSEHDPAGISEKELYIKAIKDRFKGNFSNILTRADFSSALHGTTYYKRVACGHIYITVNRYQGRPVEVFMQSSKSGGCSANTEALGRMASTMLRAGIDPDIVVDSVLGVKCAACSAIKGKGEAIDGLSCSDVMARVIKEEYRKYKDGVYDNEIEEWLSTASYEEKYDLLCGDSNTKKEVAEFTDPNLQGEEYDSEKVDGSRKLHTSCPNKTCPHRHECYDDHYWGGCCGPDDPGLPGTPGEPGIASDKDWSTLKWDYTEHTPQENIDHYICPNCGERLLLSEGCMKCINCGYSKC